MSIILITGMPGAGKEEFLKVAQDYGYKVVRMGDVVREWAEKNDIKKKDKSVGEFAQEEREEHHMGIWAERTLDWIETDKVIIDGLRSKDELNVFKEEIEKQLIKIAIHASPETRFERLKARDREDAPKSLEEFNKRDDRELSWGLGEVIAKADHMIVNESDLQEFQKKVRDLIEDIERC